MQRLFGLSLVLLLACEGRAPTPGAGAEPRPVPTTSSSPPARACDPGRTFCGDDGPRRCNAQGIAAETIALCAPGSACRATKGGLACAACDPAEVPACLDDHTIAACTPDGTRATTDCAAQRKRCLHGTCVARLCEPGRKHCHNGRLYQCNATGSERVLLQDCFAETDAGTAGVCQPDVNPPACRARCKAAPGEVRVVAADECTCDWASVPFCAEASAEGGSCVTTLCVMGGDLSVGVTPIPCFRETTGLVVPGSEKRGACAGDGEVGTMTITYEVCRDGKAVPATRTAPCAR